MIQNNFLTLLKVKVMYSISLLSFFFVLQSSYLNTTILYCTSLDIITRVCELQSLTKFCEQFAFTNHSLLIKTIIIILYFKVHGSRLRR